MCFWQSILLIELVNYSLFKLHNSEYIQPIQRYWKREVSKLKSVSFPDTLYKTVSLTVDTLFYDTLPEPRPKLTILKLHCKWISNVSYQSYQN
jgi:hypothetical protein